MEIANKFGAVLLLLIFYYVNTSFSQKRTDTEIGRQNTYMVKTYSPEKTATEDSQRYSKTEADKPRNSAKKSLGKRVFLDTSDDENREISLQSKVDDKVRQLNMKYRKKSLIRFKMKSGVEVFCSSATNCSCIPLSDGKFRADCSNRGLKSIPRFKSDVSEINLYGNAIGTFPETSVFPKNLTSLSLSNNVLTDLTNDPFKGLHDLRELDLSRNKLEYSPTIFKPQIFKDLTHLETLNLQHNNDRYHDLYPTEISRITTLKTLYLDGMDGASFHENYKNLSLLTSLYLGGTNSEVCTVRNIKVNFFQNLPPIKLLDLSICNLRYIEKDSLRKMPSLQTLDVSHNIRLTFHVLSNLSFGLMDSDIKSLILNNIHCKAGVGTVIFVDDIKDLSNTSLNRLNLAENRLEVVDSTVIDALPKTLKYLDLSHNRMRSLYLILSLLQMPSIETLNLNQQPKQANSGLSPSDLNDCQDWRGPKHNYINFLKTQHSDVSSPITYHKLKNDPILNIDVTVSPTLQAMYANNLPSQSGFMVILTFSRPNNISTIHASNGGLDSWVGGFRNLHNLTYLDLSNNFCDRLSEIFFSDYPSLKFLNIGNNMMGKLLSQDKGLNYFGKLKKLEHFDITNIGLIHLPTTILQGLSELKILNVSRNSLSDWSAYIGHMTRLSNLDLKSNRIRSLNSATRNDIDNIAINSSIKIDLSDNSLRCNCDTLSFLKWMNQRQALFVNFGDYQCVHNNALVKFKDLADILSSLEKNCASYSEVIAGVVVVILLVIALIVGGILYRYRWRIRYIYQMARKGLKPLNQANVFDFEFDVFMSYAEEDRNFVVKEALPVLEDQFGLKLRLHHRDFIPGESIATNITYNIHNSRKTVAVISTSFLKSYWCMFEFNMARMESIYSRGGEPTLLLILLEDLRPRDLPLMMLDIIDQDVYLNVPQVRNDEFWNNLKRAVSIN